MRSLGWKWVRQTVGEVENNRRRLTAEELLGLAICLETSVPRLMAPLWEDKWVELPNGMSIRVVAVVSYVGGMTVHDSIPNDISWHKNSPVQAIVSPHEAERQARHDLASRPIPAEEGVKRPIATAIVTSGLGVLVGQRHDGAPPWTFISGEIEPGESPADAAVREVKEETGLRVETGGLIGDREHPKTGRHMYYLAATPTHGTEVFVGDSDELAAVRWVSLAEADELMKAYGMFEPVREHLAQILGEAGD